jgi:hypothetical protein
LAGVLVKEIGKRKTKGKEREGVTREGNFLVKEGGRLREKRSERRKNRRTGILRP